LAAKEGEELFCDETDEPLLLEGPPEELSFLLPESDFLRELPMAGEVQADEFAEVAAEFEGDLESGGLLPVLLLLLLLLLLVSVPIPSM
jgi:hypothetical protein